ncbi:hydroxyisourate hydrolase [Pseudoroseomonas cervicalis]|uniref:hydroxyisourate hydrolase n=1 Tax=Teichococcus cervicalis TaxID=204525 RepID=UPI0022F17866|nr:hydroxyisourate hydrolase [Pseudoroseomonas cervicalis]WBV44318.1 hydroxyisourate hydrolase [Pseudoroseomonas cervicalis]
MSKPSALTTHVLDTASGRPAVGVRVELWRVAPDRHYIGHGTTNADGRTDAPLLPPEAFAPGRYELRFHIGDYFAALGLAPEPRFLDEVVLSVGLAEGQGHYHVPLLCTPWSYSTYRGS